MESKPEEDLLIELDDVIEQFRGLFSHDLQDLKQILRSEVVVLSNALCLRRHDNEKELSSLMDLDKFTKGTYPEVNQLVQIVLTFGVTSNEGKSQ